MRKPTVILSLVCAALLAPLSLSAPQAQTVAGASTAGAASTATARVIVKYKASSALLRKSILSATSEQAGAQLASQAQALGLRVGIELSAGAGVSDRSHVVFAKGINSAQLAQRLAAESDIEYAVPDMLRKRFAAPNDPFYATRAVVSGSTGGPTVGQWYLKPPGAATPNPTASTANTAPSSINAESAWGITTGSATIVVAVLDTGIRFDHADFQGGNVLPGYDMISADTDGTFTTANDGNGRDADASDPGDFVVQADAGKGACKQSDVGSSSSWHGTETAGLIGATTDNSIGIAGVGRNVRILPVRVLGKCGGYDSDILAGMLWAAGVSTPAGVPANTNPARVLNMSLGGTGTCDSSAQGYVDAIAQINAAGAVIVASAGNSEGLAVSLPANCAGVIGVVGLRHVGTKVGFSSLGPEATISAPGGNCINTTTGSECLYPILTTTNLGTTTPVLNSAGGSIYSDSFGRASLGTSFSAPLVAGTVALMLSVQPALTPDEVRFKLQSTARAFPTTGGDNGAGQPAVMTCVAPTSAVQDQCYCTIQVCGAGMLDTNAAVLAAAGVQARITVSPTAGVTGQPLTFSAATSLVPAGTTIASYQWAVTSDPSGVVPTPLAGAMAPTLTVTPTGVGTFGISLTTTDSNNVVSSEAVSVVVTGTSTTPPPPATSSGGGGGVLGAGWLLLLLAAVVALRVVPGARPRR